MVVHPAKGHWTRHAGQRPPVPLRHALDRRRRAPAGDRPPPRPRHHGPARSWPRTTTPTASSPRQFEQRTIHKEYLALVSGTPERDSDYIERPIGFHPTNREKMAIRTPEDGGKEAVTFYEVLERFRGYALVRCKPQTGRTHQIRVHLAHVGLPVLADKAYSGRDRLTLGDLLGPALPRPLARPDRPPGPPRPHPAPDPPPDRRGPGIHRPAARRHGRTLAALSGHRSANPRAMPIRPR